MLFCTPVSSAPCSFVFQCSATSFASGSSGFGADSNACVQRAGAHALRDYAYRTRRECRADACWTAHLNAEQDGADLQRWAPLVLQDVKANAAEPVNVGVVNLCDKANLSCAERSEHSAALFSNWAFVPVHVHQCYEAHLDH